MVTRYRRRISHSDAEPAVIDLQPRERLFYRDRLRSARYAALEDAEGFGEICFALEALGLRLLSRQEALGNTTGTKSLCRRTERSSSLHSRSLPAAFQVLWHKHDHGWCRKTDYGQCI